MLDPEEAAQEHQHHQRDQAPHEHRPGSALPATGSGPGSGRRSARAPPPPRGRPRVPHGHRDAGGVGGAVPSESSGPGGPPPVTGGSAVASSHASSITVAAAWSTMGRRWRPPAPPADEGLVGRDGGQAFVEQLHVDRCGARTGRPGRRPRPRPRWRRGRGCRRGTAGARPPRPPPPPRAPVPPAVDDPARRHPSGPAWSGATPWCRRSRSPRSRSDASPDRSRRPDPGGSVRHRS